MQKGALQAINLVQLKRTDKVLFITDNSTKHIANAIIKQVKKRKASFEVILMEDLGSRPVKFNNDLKNKILSSDVLFYVAQGVKGELKSFRMPMINTVREHKNLRFAHMIGINEQIMNEGMSADYSEIKKLTLKVKRIVENARTLQVTTPAGTNLKTEFNPNHKWIICDGHISPGKWSNLPDGEIFTAPKRCDGVLVVDGVIGDYFSKKYGSVGSHPLIIHVENSRIKKLECENKELLKEFEEYTLQDENSNKIGELGIGTNVGLKKLIGNLLQDEKFPGVHIAFGDPYGKETGAGWSSKAHVDVVMKECSIIVDGKKIMEKGKFII